MSHKKCTCTRHTICMKFTDMMLARSAGIFIVTKDNNIILVKEKYNKYAGLYNLPGGKCDHDDNNCYINGIKKEFREELKFKNLKYPKVFDKIFKYNYNKYEYFIINPTPIFIASVPYFDVNITNKRIKEDNADTKLPLSYKEIEECKAFKLDNDILNNNSISSYAKAAIKKYLS